MIQRIRASEYREQPWKNGGGLTREIAVALSGNRVLWRLSIATIQREGPFSEFRGYDRTIVALDGGTVELEVEGEHVTLGRGEPYDFPGEAQVACRVTGGAAHDLNVMTLRDDVAHDCEVITAPTRFVLDEDEIVFVYAIEGTATALNATCDAGDTLRVQLDDTVEIATTGSAAVVRVTPL
ncbi:MAG TPA: HutD family protein [Verrucomicrobiae bacterium]|nr:HutD family protein [Verrucomicrobiae bacterium]